MDSWAKDEDLGEVKADMLLRSDGFFFDDIGSYPLPKGMSLKNISSDQYLDLVRSTMQKKIAAGVEVPTYPQFRDMIRMFRDPIEDVDLIEAPYLIKEENAEICELQALQAGQQVRVCITGPLELYISMFGATNYKDILYNIAESVARFLRNARDQGKMCVASLDEPSLGLSSQIVFEEEEIIEALKIASDPCGGMDCEVHLHSPLQAELCAHVPGISIVGIESAAHPDYLRLIDRKTLEDTDTYLRAGIARTDILSISSSLNERLGTNLWDDIPRLENEILKMESISVMRKRLEAAHALFGERLRAVGPDCGLGSWPNQDIAGKMLANCAAAVKSFRKDNER
jgi:5-methyltetrahydropteroyltriglutamate--homocysteine methyltransferase